MHSVLVTGVQGVGKTTVTKIVASRLGVAAWDYANLMLRADRTLGEIDDIQSLAWDHRCAVYGRVRAALPSIFSEDEGPSRYVLLENHLSIVDEEGIRVFEHDAIALYRPLALVVLEAEPASILNRRAGDRNRRRVVGTIEEIEGQQQTNRREALIISRSCTLPLLIARHDETTSTSAEVVAWVEAAVRK